MHQEEELEFSFAISPYLEMGSYEYLWQIHKTFSRLSSYLKEKLNGNENQQEAIESRFFIEKISQLIQNKENAKLLANQAMDELRNAGIEKFGIRVQGETEFPLKLLDAKNPAYCLYYQGYWNLVYSPCISVVGTRKPSREGIKRTQQMVRKLVRNDFTIVSGLAKGIDTVAHETALEEGGRTIAVLGTPLQQQYPSCNKALRKKLEEQQLVISQFPVFSKTKPYFFPERNKIMSVLSKGTVIIEAGNTSGTRVQAAAALEQKRKLFILNSCFENSQLTWPQKFQARGGICVREYADIENVLDS